MPPARERLRFLLVQDDADELVNLRLGCTEEVRLVFFTGGFFHISRYLMLLVIPYFGGLVLICIEADLLRGFTCGFTRRT